MKHLLVLGMLLSVFAGAAGQAQTQHDSQLNILFIGNSFTYRHDLPALVKTVCVEGQPGLKVNTRYVVYGGQNLFTHWTYFRSQTFLELSTITREVIEERIAHIKQLQALTELPPEYVKYPETLGKQIKMPPLDTFQGALKWALTQHEQLLTSNPRTRWDYVVLQSWVDEHADPDQGYARWAREFAEVARQHGAQVILYITAPFVQNAKPVDKPQQEWLVKLQLQVARQLADQIKPHAVVPVPLAINLIQQDGTDLTFCYEKDFHPNQTTAFLTANMFYAALFNQSTEGFQFDTVTETRVDGEGKAPDGGDPKRVFDEKTRVYLQKKAFEAMQAFAQVGAAEAAN